MDLRLDDVQQSPLRILPLCFTLRSSGMRFPDFSGSVWHGGLGNMLAKHAPAAFACLYQTDPESRLYALLPDMCTLMPAGELFELRVTLFGKGTEHALAVTQAIAELGRAGMRPGGHYELLQARSLMPECDVVYLSARRGFIELPQAIAATAFLAEHYTSQNACRIKMVTPLRVKEGGEFMQHAPDYAQLLRRIFSRLDQLAHVAQEATPLAKPLREKVYAEAEQISISHSALQRYRLERRSARSAQQMQFSGLLGTVDYVGVMQHSLPWFRLASITQLGGKTAFGFGGLKIQSGIDCVE